MPICGKCGSRFPNWLRINGKQRSLTKRRFCLECSPFGKRNRRDLSREFPASKQCKGCREVLDIDSFYVYNDGRKIHPHCKECLKGRHAKRQAYLKNLAVEYKGGSCQSCGYNRYLGALDFHHRNPNEKRFGIASKLGWSAKSDGLTPELITELDKCDLLCANCHREVEGGYHSCINPL